MYSFIVKFNKQNPIHYFIYIYGYLIFILVFSYQKLIKKDKKERIVLYGHRLYGNLKSIYLELESSEFEYYFLTLDISIYRKLKKNNFRVLYGLKFKDIYMVASSKYFITDHGLHYMKKLIMEKDNYFFDVNHGLPFQKWNEKIISQWYKYTEVWLFSEFHKKIYVEDFKYKESNLVITGYGRLDYIKKFNLSQDKQKISKEIKLRYSLPVEKKVALYAPTWIHNKKKVINEFMTPNNINFLKYLNEIAKDNNMVIIYRPHLNTYLSQKFISELKNFYNIFYFPFRDYEEVEDFLLVSDILITDWSSISFDYILLDRPVIFLDTENSFPLGVFKEDLLRFGIVSDLKNLKSNIITYKDNHDLYHKKFPNQKKIKTILYDDFESIVSQKYIDRIKIYK